jgi:menaquinone-dependent protoporphyrinogen oxidase
MSNILLVYGTAYGQTARITQRIALVLTDAGHTVTVQRGDLLPPDLSLGEYNAFFVAASVLFGRHQRYIRSFVRSHVARLNAAPSAFVSVCGAAAGSAPEGAGPPQGYVDKFLRETGWRPWATRSFAGALPYTRYGPFVRWMMRMISRRTGRPTDASRDYDFTDWEAVDRFARELAETLAVPGPASGAGAPGAAGPT